MVLSKIKVFEGIYPPILPVSLYQLGIYFSVNKIQKTNNKPTCLPS